MMAGAGKRLCVSFFPRLFFFPAVSGRLFAAGEREQRRRIFHRPGIWEAHKAELAALNGGI